MSSFDRCFAVIVGSEGGYVNDPNDPGGETKFGISKRAYASVNIAGLTTDDARTIYLRDYWNKIRGDDLPIELALLVFDAAVNSGVSRAARWLQTAVRVPADGMIGPRTIAAVLSKHPGWVLAAEYNALRLMFATALPLWKLDGHGWGRRLCRLPYQSLGVAQSLEVAT